ncbi:MAG: hypothetical protein GC179_30175 [Anaerolineaceae bacterium]|nr:hypothetical protein [Anaerolineaceae bacterium]
MIVRILLIAALNILWVGIMVVTLIMPTMPEFMDNSILNSVLGGILCNTDEHLQRLQTESAGINSFCVNTTTESKRNVSENLGLIGLVATGITFLVTTTAEVLFAFSLKRKRNSKEPVVEVVTTPRKPDINITETLRQLEEARKAGLISYDEYDRKRQEIYKNL